MRQTEDRPMSGEDQRRLEQALAVIRREQDAHTYGVVEVHLQAGRIVRTRTSRTEDMS